MKKNALQFIIDGNGNYLDSNGSLRALTNYVGMLQVITPLPLDDAVGVNFLVYDSTTEDLSQYVIPTAYKGRDVIEETDVLYQTAYDWNVFEVEIFEKALAYISKHHQGRVGISFAFHEIVPSARAITYKGLFGADIALPTTGQTIGDYYACADYNYGVQGFIFGKGQFIYWNGTKWLKDRMKLVLTTPTLDIPVDPTLSVEYKLTDDEINYLASIGADVANLGIRMNAAEADIDELQADVIAVEADTAGIKNGTIIVGKATGDKNGNDIFVTYETKADATTHKARTSALESTIPATYETKADATAHKTNTNNPHQVTKAQVGLGDVDNTTDMGKPVSNLQAAAIAAAVSNHNSSGSAHEDIRNMIAALVGAYVYRGTINISEPSDVQLNARIVELLDRNPVIGDVLVDTDKNEWYFNGTDWNNYGQFIIGLASATSDGLMTKEFFAKLDDLYNRTDLDLVLATKVDKVTGKSLIDDLLITKISELYSKAQLDAILANIYTKSEVDAIFDQLKAIYGWKDSDLGTINTGGTIAVATVDQYDFIVVQIKTGTEITSKIFKPEEILTGESITEIINTTPTVTSIIAKGATNYTFTISTGTATAHFMGVKMDYGLLNEVRQVGTTQMSFVNGKLTSVVSDNVSTYLAYDTNGNIQKIIETYADGKSYETTYTKDVEGRIKTMTKAEV